MLEGTEKLRPEQAAFLVKKYLVDWIEGQLEKVEKHPGYASHLASMLRVVEGIDGWTDADRVLRMFNDDEPGMYLNDLALALIEGGFPDA